MNILQRFLSKKTTKPEEFLSKEQLFEAPVLYRIPTYAEVKKMIKLYLERKKIL